MNETKYLDDIFLFFLSPNQRNIIENQYHERGANHSKCIDKTTILYKFYPKSKR